MMRSLGFVGPGYEKEKQVPIVLGKESVVMRKTTVHTVL